jgi:hypothetical protein
MDFQGIFYLLMGYMGRDEFIRAVYNTKYHSSYTPSTASQTFPSSRASLAQSYASVLNRSTWSSPSLSLALIATAPEAREYTAHNLQKSNALPIDTRRVSNQKT